MKKFLCGVLSVFFAFSLCACGDGESSSTESSSTGTETILKDENGFIFERRYGEQSSIKDYKIVGIESVSPVLIIPDTFNGERVAAIGERAFENCDEIETIILTEEIAVIDEYAFNDCDGLKHVYIPFGVSEISAYAFADCDNLKAVTFGDTNNWCIDREYGFDFTDPYLMATYLTTTYKDKNFEWRLTS